MVTVTRRLRGETLVLTLITLLVLCLGFLYTLRSVTFDAQMAGNTLARQKDTQVADIALRTVESQILAVYGAQPLEVSATLQPWFRTVGAGTAAPDSSYWANCSGNASTALRCAALTVTVNSTLAYNVLAVVQPTGQSDAYACGLSQYRALYYDIFLNVAEPNGATSSTVETIYRVCTLS